MHTYTQVTISRALLWTHAKQVFLMSRNYAAGSSPFSVARQCFTSNATAVLANNEMRQRATHIHAQQRIKVNNGKFTVVFFHLYEHIQWIDNPHSTYNALDSNMASNKYVYTSWRELDKNEYKNFFFPMTSISKLLLLFYFLFILIVVTTCSRCIAHVDKYWNYVSNELKVERSCGNRTEKKQNEECS